MWLFLRFTCSIMCTQHAADLNVIWLCVCVQAGAAAWEPSVCVGAEHYGGLHHAREMPLRTHALPAGLSSAPPKNLWKQKRLQFPRSAAAQVASVVGSRGNTSCLPKTFLPLSLSPFRRPPVPLHLLPHKLPRVFHQPLRNQRPFHSSNRLLTPGPTSTFL